MEGDTLAIPAGYRAEQRGARSVLVVVPPAEKPPEPLPVADARLRDALGAGIHKPTFHRPWAVPTEAQEAALETGRKARRSLLAAWPRAGWLQTPAGLEPDPALLQSVVLTDHEIARREGRYQALRAEYDAAPQHSEARQRILAKLQRIAVRVVKVAIPTAEKPEGWAIWANAAAIKEWRRAGLRPKVVERRKLKMRRPPTQVRWMSLDALDFDYERLTWLGPTRGQDISADGRSLRSVVRAW